MTLRAAIRRIDQRGMLLVFPINNAKVPPSLWSEFYPRSRMQWEWDEGGDNRVADLWHLRTELSASGKVVYGKWYRGRATFFSRKVFEAMLACLGNPRSASQTARRVLAVLEGESPLSTKVLKKETGLQGKVQEGLYARALKELWSHLLIVGYGEVEDGAFPSLAVGATHLLFEDLSRRAEKLGKQQGVEVVRKLLKDNPSFLQEFEKKLSISAAIPTPKSRERLLVRGTDLAVFSDGLPTFTKK